MKANWFIQLSKLANTDDVAKQLLTDVQNAQTKAEKDETKTKAKEYIESLQPAQETTSEPIDSTEQETNVATESAETESVESVVETIVKENKVVDSDIVAKDKIETLPEFDMNQPAFNPRLAKQGITREEELFIHGVFVRKLSREEKLLMRRSIYQKRKARRTAIQNAWQIKRKADLAARMADPEYQKKEWQRKFVLKIKESLMAHNNISYMLTHIDGLTVDVIRELLKNPANVNEFNRQDESFIVNFHKKFGA